MKDLSRRVIETWGCWASKEAGIAYSIGLTGDGRFVMFDGFQCKWVPIQGNDDFIRRAIRARPKPS
jgi:hypothetical protein